LNNPYTVCVPNADHVIKSVRWP